MALALVVQQTQLIHHRRRALDLRQRADELARLQLARNVEKFSNERWFAPHRAGRPEPPPSAGPRYGCSWRWGRQGRCQVNCQNSLPLNRAAKRQFAPISPTFTP